MSLDRFSPPPEGRLQLAKVLGRAGDVISIDDITATLGLTRSQAAKRLARWTEQGWLRRVQRGTYLPVPLDSLTDARVLADPWILVPALFDPAYLGGRSAAEHWDLTEQIFGDLVVMTSRRVRARDVVRHGVRFRLKHIAPEALFGTKVVWRQNTKVSVSDVHRTIIDMLVDPELGGGLQHVADCLAIYLSRRDRDDERLIAYGQRLGQGVMFKRLGFLAERLPGGERLAKACQDHLTRGVSELDPDQPGGRIITRWQLRVPHLWSKELVKGASVRGRSL